MFTGLIEEIGMIAAVEQTAAGSRLSIEAKTVLSDAKLGDSIAIDGVCTTVIALDNDTFTIEASPETLAKTTFKYLTPGKRVNLERPLTPTSRIGGHFVTGHVDGTASVIARFEEGNSWIYRMLLDQPELGVYLIPKGSIAVSGISLTVNTVEEKAGKTIFTVAIIPHTLTHTSLGDYQPGTEAHQDTVNIECDMLGKYVARLLANTTAQPRETTHPKSQLHTGVWFCHDEAIHQPLPDANKQLKTR